MTSPNHSADAVSQPLETSSWRAVFAIAFSVACLLTAEFLPVSLLTPMAQGLGITEGMAGQSVAVTALAAIFASLFATSATRGIDRRRVVLGYAVLLILSSLLTAIADGFSVLLIGRALLGLALGGFWAPGEFRRHIAVLVRPAARSQGSAGCRAAGSGDLCSCAGHRCPANYPEQWRHHAATRAGNRSQRAQ